MAGSIQQASSPRLSTIALRLRLPDHRILVPGRVAYQATFLCAGPVWRSGQAGLSHSMVLSINGLASQESRGANSLLPEGPGGFNQDGQHEDSYEVREYPVAIEHQVPPSALKMALKERAPLLWRSRRVACLRPSSRELPCPIRHKKTLRPLN
jgi:hypothetical protein